jgi:DNA-binding GntR family transcriptional regulator
MGEQVYQALLAQILSPGVSPGDRITIDAVARELGVSQTPIREALHRLENEGIVVRNHLSGYRVAAPITRQEFEDLVELRLLLEPAIARRAAERIGLEDLGGLRALNDSMVTSAAEGQGSGYATFARLDAELHDRIADGAGNQVMRTALNRLHTHVRLFRLNYNFQITSQAIQEHEAVLEAIGARDPDGAAFAMRAHILASSERFRAGFATEGRQTSLSAENDLG